MLPKGTAPKTLARFAALCLALLFTSAVRAQDAGTQTPTPQEAPSAQRPGLLSKLNLTPEQRVRLRELRRQSEPEARTLARRLNLARRALDEAVYADETDEAAIDQRAREVAEAHAALLRLRAQTELRVRRVLTPEQLQTFRALRAEALRQRRLERRQAAPARRRLRRQLRAVNR